MDLFSLNVLPLSSGTDLVLFQTCVFLGGCAFFSTLDYLIDKYKLEKLVRKQKEVIPKTFPIVLSKTMLNHFLITAPTIYFTSFYISSATNFISYSKIFYAIFWEEILFYHLHRLFHEPFLYKFHKLHHSLTKPFAAGVIYAHPLEHFFVNLFPIVASALMADLNMPEVYFWTFLATTSRLISHAGYNFISDKHDEHHQYFNMNYGLLGVMDFLYKTNKKN